MNAVNTAKVNQFLRNALTGESNKTEDPLYHAKRMIKSK